MDPHSLNYLTLTSECVAFIVAVFLPPVKHSLYFHKREEDKEPLDNKAPPAINSHSNSCSNHEIEGTNPTDDQRGSENVKKNYEIRNATTNDVSTITFKQVSGFYYHYVLDKEG